MQEHQKSAPSLMRSVAPLLGIVVVGLIAAGVVSSLQGGAAVTPAPTAPVPPPAVAPEVAETPEPAAPVAVEAPAPPAVRVRTEAERMADLTEAELAKADEREQVRLRAAAPDGLGTADESFAWLPDRDDAAGINVARRMAREARERITEMSDSDEVAKRVLEAHVQERTGDPDSAIYLCNEALDRDPRYGTAWTVRGWARLAREDVDGAELDLARGARLSHETTWAHVGLGRVAERRGDAKAAIKAYELALFLGGARDKPFDHEGDLRVHVERLRASMR